MSQRDSRIVASLSGLTAGLVLLGVGWALRPYFQERRDLPLLDSSNLGEAQAAAARLAKLGSRRATERLVKLLASSDDRPWVSEALKERLPDALALLGAELEDGWDEGDLRVVRFLENLGADARSAAPSLVKALEHLDEEDATFAVSFALLEIDPRTYELVRPLLRSPAEAARLNALGIFCMADAVPGAHLPEVAALLEDAAPAVRSKAAWTLSRLRPDAATARSALLPRLVDPDLEARVEAACALVRLGAAGEEVVPALRDGLGAPSFHTTAKAVGALEALGPLARATVTALVALLQDPSSLSIDALDALLQIDPCEAARLAAPLLHAGDGEVRRRALIAIGPLSLHDPSHVSLAARAAVEMPEQELRTWANGALGELGPAAEEAVPSLIELLREPNPDLQDLACYILGGIGEAAGDAVPALRALQADPALDPDVRRAAELALSSILGTERPTPREKLGPREAERLALDLESPDLEKRELALVELQESDGAPDSLLPVVVRCLQDDEPTIRAAALRALDLWPLDLDRALRVAAALGDSAAAVRDAAVCRLAGLEPVPAKVLREVQGSLASPDAGVRIAALSALAGWGDASRPAETTIAQRLGDVDPAVRDAAISTLEALASLSWASVTGLGSLLGDANVDVRRAVARALLGAGAAASVVAEPLHEAMADPDSRVRVLAATALLAVKPDAEEARKLLATTLEQKEPGELAARLGARLGARGAPLLRLALRSPSWEVRAAGAECVSEQGVQGAWAVPELVHTLADPDGLVRSRAILALAAIGAPARAAGEALANAALQDDDYNRVWAAYALGRLGVHHDIAVRALVRELKDGRTEELSERAAEYLGRLGSAGLGAIPDLESALRSRHSRVRMAAVAALGQLRRVDDAARSSGQEGTERP